MPTTSEKSRRARADRIKKGPGPRGRRLRSITGARDQAGKALSGYDEAYLACRDLKHPWEQVGFYRQAGEVRRLLRCPRCDMQRIDRWRPNGERVANQYEPPEGYRISGGQVTAYEVRREVLARVTIFETHDQMVKALLRKAPARKRA